MVGPGKPNALSTQARTRALAYISSHPEIWEVILTGGDPLVASARRLSDTLRALAAIDHVKVLRIHTRMPIAAPETITPALVRALKVKAKPTWLAVHVNHARELGRDQRAAIARLADAGIPLLGQTVLLKGVNDTVESLEALMRALVECRIKPYYLHHADLAPGTAHLRTDIATGQALMRALRGRVSGLSQPDYVLDIPGGHGKAPIGPTYLKSAQTGVAVTDFTGAAHAYPPAAD
jgi:lysine 2,3-aminomutase